MHTTTKEVITDPEVAEKLDVPEGSHVITTICEADGPFELCSDKAKVNGEVISIKRTASGGVEIKTAFQVVEPKIEAASPVAAEPVKTPEETAVEFLVKSKGLSQKEAKAAVERFGATKILAKQQEELDGELAALVGQKPPASQS